MNQDAPQPEKGSADAQAASTQHMDSAEALLQRSPRKGFVYENAMHPILEAIAAGFGDEYIDTSKTPGLVPQCMKGDSLLIITDHPGLPREGARVVFEMSDSDTSNRRWNPYLEESEQNRGAHTSVGLVRYRGQVPQGKDTRAYGSRRIVVAFDPEIDDPDDLLTTVIILARNRAIFDAVSSGAGSVVDAVENLTDALRLVDELPGIRMLAAKVRTIADQVLNRIDSVHPRLDRSLGKVASALEDQSHRQPPQREDRT